MSTKKRFKRLAWVMLILFLFGNFLVYNQVYRFTHFSETVSEKTRKPEDMSLFEKLNTLILGVEIPKPLNRSLPKQAYETLAIQSGEELEAWLIEPSLDNGLVIMFHGYSSAKSSLLDYSKAFNEKGYSTLLVDFMGSGGSTGHLTTIGVEESKDVKAVYDFVKKEYPDREIILFGCSMGAVSIMKSIADFDIHPDKLIVECPFGWFRETTKIRFEAMNMPAFPFVDLLMLHGGWQLGFNPYQHNPVDYAQSIDLPVLLLSGRLDRRVPVESVESVFEHLKGPKTLGILEQSGHEIYLNRNGAQWHAYVDEFLTK